MLPSYLRPYNKYKLDFRTSSCIFLGYSPLQKGYKCLTSDGKVIISIDVISYEFTFLFFVKLNLSSSPLLPTLISNFSIPIVSFTPNNIVSSVSSSSKNSYSTFVQVENLSNNSNIQEAQPLRVVSSSPSNIHRMLARSKMGHSRPKVLTATTYIVQPSSAVEALHAPHWKQVIKEELVTLSRT